MNDKDHDQPDWRQARYQRFYEVVDHIVPEILALQEDDGRVKRRLAGKQLNQLVNGRVKVSQRAAQNVATLGLG